MLAGSLGRLGWLLAGAVLVLAGTAACAPRLEIGSLRPTLTQANVNGGTVAVQNGIPVPTFAWQPRLRIDLDGSWRIQRANLDSDLSVTDRGQSLGAIVAAGGGREKPDFDDASWATQDVPGAFNNPPDRTQGGAWYRLRFAVPQDWSGQTATLKFGAVNYIADAWLNGTYLGVHEGGYTPFAFDVTDAIRPGGDNVLAIRVDNPVWGSRTDIVPWGLADWWNYGGITQPVWLEASPPMHLVRLDVTPHLDGADISVVVRNRGTASEPGGRVRIELFPAEVTDANILDPDPRSLVPIRRPPLVPPLVFEPGDTGRIPFASVELPVGALAAGGVARLSTSFLFDRPDLWRPGHPALEVAWATLIAGDGTSDRLLETFGLRRIGVDPGAPRLLLNGSPFTFVGAALHDETIVASAGGTPVTAHRVTNPAIERRQLTELRDMGGTLVRTGHTPPNPALLALADRLGIGVWEEIPLYHYTPQTFTVAMDRGIARQMLQEMALRDMNHPSVLFHGLANESTGDTERAAALRELNDADRQIDGTRLTGQAAYGFDPTDATSADLDVAGVTFYYGVFYGTDPTTDTARALDVLRRTYPDKPIMALEFGHWADQPGVQSRIFTATHAAFAPRLTTEPGGSIAGELWWSLEDYYTLRPNLEVEAFGLVDPTGAPRPVAAVAAAAWTAVTGRSQAISASQPTGVVARPPVRASAIQRGGTSLAVYAAYAVALSLLTVVALLALMIRRANRSEVARS